MEVGKPAACGLRVQSSQTSNRVGLFPRVRQIVGDHLLRGNSCLARHYMSQLGSGRGVGGQVDRQAARLAGVTRKGQTE